MYFVQWIVCYKIVYVLSSMDSLLQDCLCTLFNEFEHILTRKTFDEYFLFVGDAPKTF